MKGKAAKDMCLKVCKDLAISEMTLVTVAAFYFNGKWRAWIETDELDGLWERYEEGIVDEMVVNFCLDIESGRLPPNYMMNKIESMKIKSPKKGKP